VTTAMNVHVGMYTCAPRPIIGWVGLYISGVDFGCFSTSYGDCEALEEREEQVNFTLFVLYNMVKYRTKTGQAHPRCERNRNE